MFEFDLEETLTVSHRAEQLRPLRQQRIVATDMDSVLRTEMWDKELRRNARFGTSGCRGLV